MQELIIFFENITSLQRSIILVGGITFFWSVESIIPLFKFDYKKLKHAIPNFFFTLTTILVNFSLAFLLLFISDYVVLNNFGLLNYLDLSISIYLILPSKKYSTAISLAAFNTAGPPLWSFTDSMANSTHGNRE